ncbi:uncharacterized protein LOC135165834 isoform X2 [Diachasmimorpha longicaudata]|uniref:uncharacterized protein LOC135165834 isoform X2 n=1 Tax=Diachasmimorpha longicaudata TaxID=58733 RepID=UPI0030B8C6C6
MEAGSTQQRKEKVPRVHRPCAFDKMEGLVRKMQDAENGVPVGSQKQFLTSIPSAFMGYDLVEWLIDRLSIDETEAVHLANQLCQYGYFFPVNDSKTLTVKDDSSLYRFQTPYYWPWQHRTPDNVEYAIYLAKRTLRNKQRHALEEYEIEALNSLRKNLANKWELIQMQAEEQVRLSKERKKGDKIVSDSQERAFWRVYRPPPGCPSSLEVVPVPTRARPGAKLPVRKRTLNDLQREVELLRNSLTRTRTKVSVAIENLKTHYETYTEYDPLIVPPQPSNPWMTDDQSFWQLNSPLVDVPTEKRVKRWGLSMEELMFDPTGLLEFTNYLRKEYSHENIRFWLAVKDLRHCNQAHIGDKVNEIFREFLAPGAPCEINIDGKTMEKVHQEMKNPSRFTFDAAAEHVYTLLLKKDCYPRFIRSDHYRNLVAAGVQPLQKKRFFNFGGQTKKKTTTSGGMGGLQQASMGGSTSGGRRRGSDRSLSGSAHELAICGIRDVTTAPRVPHSLSQQNLTDIPYRGDLERLTKNISRPSPRSVQDAGATETSAVRPMDDVCPWDAAPGPSNEPDAIAGTSSGSTDPANWSGMPLPPDTGSRASRKNSSQFDSCSSSSDVSIAITEASERLRKTCGLQHSSTIVGPNLTRNYSVGPVPRVKLADTSRSSISSCNFPSPQHSFDLSGSHLVGSSHPVLQLHQLDVAKSVPEESENWSTEESASELDDSKESRAPGIAPLISISTIVGDIACESGELEEDSIPVTIEEVPEVEEKLNEKNNENVEGRETDSGEEAQVVPVWVPEDNENDPEGQKEGSEQVPGERDNNVNEVCPWEDEENCRVDATYVKTYATLGYL